MSTVVLASANLRDLGGIVTRSGSTVRPGCLYRGGHLAALAEDELATVAALGLRTIVDLRRESEIEHHPTPPLDGVEGLHLSTSAADNEFAVLAGSLHRTEVLDVADDMVSSYYARMAVERAGFFRPVVAATMDAGRRPLLFHCTAGKDRTGWTAAIVLRLLDVADDRIIEDYVWSNAIRAPWIEARSEQLRARIAEAIGTDPDEIGDDQLEGARALLTVKSDYLRSAFDAVDEAYGSWDGFRRDALGVSDTALGAFRAALLDDGG